MASSFDRVIIHTVFSTKHRADLIHESIEKELYQFIASRLQHHNSQLIRINGTANHLHILHSLPRTITIAKLMEDIKSLSSKWIKSKGGIFTDFAWQEGYGVFSVDQRNLDGIIFYVENQKKHHQQQAQKISFEEEFIHLLDEYGIDYDPKYLF